jgi:hypothetical protein
LFEGSGKARFERSMEGLAAVAENTPPDPTPQKPQWFLLLDVS